MIKKNIVPKQNSGTKMTNTLLLYFSKCLFKYKLPLQQLSDHCVWKGPPSNTSSSSEFKFQCFKTDFKIFFAKACGVTTGSVCHSWVLDFSQQFVFKFYCTCESFLCPFNRYVVSLCAPEKKIPKTHITLPNLHSEFWSWACSVDLTGIATEALTLNK